MSTFENWHEEKQSAHLYRILAEVEAENPRGKLFTELARHAEEQAEVWRKNGKLENPAFHPGFKVTLVGRLTRLLGVRPMSPVLAALKIRGLSTYSSAKPLVAGHPTPTEVADIGRRHNVKGGGNNIRAAVFGINDGLVSNASLILGVAAAASLDPKFILVSGTAGLLAGALSMASGEYVSVRSQRELLEYQLGLEAAELEQYPEEEAEELALIYEARGIAIADARQIAHQLIANPKQALDTLAREELGLDPDDLGSPWGAAISSFIAFSIGALIPLLPFVVSPSREMVWVAIALTAAALFTTGVTVSLFSGRHFFKSGLRMLLIGGGAGTISYLIGSLIGG